MKYKIEKYDDYNFRVSIQINPTILGNVNITIDDTYKNVISGTLGSGTIGMTILYYLEDKSVSVDAFSHEDSSIYVSEYKQYIVNDNIWSSFKTLTQENKAIIHSSLTKEFKNVVINTL